MTRRLAIVRAIVALLCAVILGRLVQLQVIEGRRNRELADNNRIRVSRALAPRGTIRDRRGRLLATSRLAFTINVAPDALRSSRTKHPEKVLARLLGLEAADLSAYLQRQRAAGRDSVPLLRDAPRDVVAKIEEYSPYLSGVSVLTDAVRYYPQHRLAAHLLGYVRDISERELQMPQYSDYRPLDLIGKAGVERVAEAALRGVDGGRQIEVDARGRQVRSLGLVPPRAGHSVRLTLDLDLQRVAAQALGGKPGAAVALDPRTGEILALASSPSYDPNAFVGSLSAADWRRLSGPGHPQQNRATTSLLPPGSLFKIVTAAAALESGETSSGEWFHCTGTYRIGGWRMRCWKRTGHGDVDFTRGFAQSCNVMFATLGRRVGVEGLAAMARRFGLGRPTGIDMPEESSGLIPDADWKKKRRHQPWYPGDTCQMAVGQGDCLVTPLQMAQMVAAVANGGKLMRPQVVLEVEGEQGPREPIVTGDIGLKASTLAAISAGMVGVVSPGGTASRIASGEYEIAGKTGTAQAPGGAPHAWFAGFAPADNPRIAVAVVVEHGGNGSVAAAPIAKRIFDAALLQAQSAQARLRNGSPG